MFIGNLSLAFGLSACSYNPLNANNHLTGNVLAAGAGAAVGAGTAAALGASKPGIVAAGIGGASVGYYLSTLRFAAGGVIQAGGQVYQVGDYVTVEIPSDQLFEPNTASLIPSGEPALKSTVNVLRRYPNHNIIISGNTSGFGPNRWERKLSEDRARQVASYLWANGIQELRPGINIEKRMLTYVGYGSYFPIANDLTNEGIRSNNRIQITVYPTSDQLLISKRVSMFGNIDSVTVSSNDPNAFYTLDEWNKKIPQADLL